MSRNTGGVGLGPDKNLSKHKPPKVINLVSSLCKDTQ